jgi:hypothetical protein
MANQLMHDPVGDIIGRGFAAMQHEQPLARGIDIGPYALSHLGQLAAAYRATEAALPEGLRLDGLCCASTGLGPEERSDEWRALAADRQAQPLKDEETTSPRRPAQGVAHFAIGCASAVRPKLPRAWCLYAPEESHQLWTEAH